MAKWTYINSAADPDEIIEIEGTQYQAVTDVEAYATAQSHTILGGSSPPNTSIVRMAKDTISDFTSVNTDGDVVFTSNFVDTNGNSLNTVTMIKQSTGSTMNKGTGAVYSANTTDIVATTPSTGEYPTMWAGDDIANNGRGKFVTEGEIDNLNNVRGNGDERQVVPITTNSNLYWDIDNQRFSTSAADGPRCGTTKNDGSYILSKTTTLSNDLALSNLLISSETAANEVKNSTVVVPASVNANRLVEVPNLSSGQARADAFVVGDQVCVVVPKTSNNYTVTVDTESGGSLQNLAGSSIASYVITTSATEDQSVIIERIAGNHWKVVYENENVVNTNIVVSQRLLAQEREATREMALSENYEFFYGFNSRSTTVSTLAVDPGKCVSDDGTTMMEITSQATFNVTTDLDTGSEASDTWYYVFLMYNPSTDAHQLVGSTSHNNPQMPSGYTKKRLLTVVYNNSSSNFRPFEASGARDSKTYTYLTEYLTVNNQQFSARSNVSVTGAIPLLPSGYPMFSVTIEYTSVPCVVYNGAHTTSKAFLGNAPGYGWVSDIVADASGNMQLAGHGGITQVYMKVQSFKMEL